MTKLKTNVQLDASCILTVSDVSGFYDSTTAPNGFLPEADSAQVVADVYKISNGYFINLLTYNAYNVTPALVNTQESWYTPATVQSTYANNFTPSNYILSADGTYTLSRVFMISDTFYDAHKNSGLFTNKTIYYTDGVNVYLVHTDITTTIVPLATLANLNLTGSTAIVLATTFISTCQLSNCYFLLMSKLLDLGMSGCTTDTQMHKSRDFIYMTLETIKYLQDFGNNSQIQKLIEGVTGCGICGDTTKTTDCGCNG
jgi:hypothetical protein